jgi:hypothetical protein
MEFCFTTKALFCKSRGNRLTCFLATSNYPRRGSFAKGLLFSFSRRAISQSWAFVPVAKHSESEPKRLMQAASLSIHSMINQLPTPTLDCRNGWLAPDGRLFPNPGYWCMKARKGTACVHAP